MVYNTSIITTIPTYGAGWNSMPTSKIAIPVSPSSYIYSHFKHVSGVPATEGQQGVPITKLKILDALIDQLSQMKKTPQRPVSEDRIDALLEQYKKEIAVAQAAHRALPYNPKPPENAPILVNLVA